jgi:hypothetical protein
MFGVVATEGLGMSSRALPPLLRLGVLTACCAWAMALSVETFVRQPRASIEWPDQFEHEDVIWQQQKLDPLNATPAKTSTAALPHGVLQLNEATYHHGLKYMELILLGSSSSGFSGRIQIPQRCERIKNIDNFKPRNNPNLQTWILGINPATIQRVVVKCSR